MTRFKDVKSLPCVDREIKLNAKYVKYAMRSIEGGFSVDFQLEEAQEESGSDCTQEFSALLHPRVATTVSGISEENYPEDDSKLRKKIEAFIRKDQIESSRLIHPKCKQVCRSY